MNLEKQRENFKNHIAKFTDYGNIKILDFKEPESSHYRIRFLFEEDYCRLHISGDLGELVATNYSNMTYEKFSDFVNDIGYFEGKIDCMNRKIYVYDEGQAREDILNLMDEYDVKDEFMNDRFDFETIDDVVNDILEDFDKDRGIGSKEYTTVMHELLTDSYIVFFGAEPCYKVTNANETFFDDLGKRRMASLSEAKKAY